MNPQDSHEFVALIDAHLDGVLSDEQASRLQTWLLADPANALVFATRAQEHMHLRQIFSGDPLARLTESVSEAFAMDQPEAITLDMLSLLEDPSDELHLVDLTQRMERERRSKHDPRLIHPHGRPQAAPQPRPLISGWALTYLGGLAAAALIALLVYPLLTEESTQPIAPPVSGPVAIEAPKGGAVQAQPAEPAPAVLLASHRAQWSRSGGQAAADGAMATGTYKLRAGYAHLTMADGTALIIEGPAQFTIVSGSHVTLSQGSLSADVPTRAARFVVEMPWGQVQDLAGTRFGIEVIDAQSAEVHVMAGAVSASLHGHSESHAIRAERARRIDADSDQIERVVMHGEKFAQDWDQVERSIRVSDAVRYLYETPKSVAPGDLEDNDLLFILPEKRGVVVPSYSVLCDFLEPGRYDRLPRNSKALPSGAVVDSYLLHYDRVGQPRVLTVVTGTIHFDRPIVGVVASAEWITASDAMFQGGNTRYPATNYAGRGFEGFGHNNLLQDVVTISADRMTLTVRLATSTNIDHLRVLVEAGPTDSN